MCFMRSQKTSYNSSVKWARSTLVAFNQKLFELDFSLAGHCWTGPPSKVGRWGVGRQFRSLLGTLCPPTSPPNFGGGPAQQVPNFGRTFWLNVTGVVVDSIFNYIFNFGLPGTCLYLSPQNTPPSAPKSEFPGLF